MYKILGIFSLHRLYIGKPNQDCRRIDEGRSCSNLRVRNTSFPIHWNSCHPLHQNSYLPLHLRSLTLEGLPLWEPRTCPKGE